MIGDAATLIAGGKVRVATLMGPGVDPHKFLPSARDLDTLSGAKLLLFNGLHLEGKMVDVLETARAGRRAVPVTRSLQAAGKLRKADSSDGGEFDPHVWFDVQKWRECVLVIRDEMIESFPEHAETFRANAATYLAELDQLDQEVRSLAQSIPKDRRVLITSHDAFAYFGAAYDFEVHGLQGVSTASASATNDVEALAELIVRKNVRVIFTETSVPTQGLKQVLDTVQSRSGRAITLKADREALYSDALGDASSPGSSYIGMIRHNITTLVNALRE
jgi:manganese/zinc/iron transport system substrate-binding protein